MTGDASWAADAVAALEGAFTGWGDGPQLVAGAVDLGAGATAASASDLLFEIGSITKTLTATVLATAVLREEVRLEDPIGRWLAAGPNAGITLLQLATHTSGLPRLAPNHEEAELDPADPYAAFTAELAEAGLREATLDASGVVGYSNFGFQLLGLALERATGSPLPSLFAEQVFVPLGMTSACVEPPPGARPAQPHAADGPVPRWSCVLPGPGGVLATVDDLVAYVTAVLDPPPGEVGDAIRLATTPVAAGDVGLAWQLPPSGAVWHNGGTAGSRSMLACDRASGRGVVAVASTGEADAIDQAVVQVLRGRPPVPIEAPVDDPAWGEPGLAVVALLAAEAWDDVRDRMAGGLRDLATPATLAELWADLLAANGPFRHADLVRSRRVGAGGAARILLRFETGTATLDATFDAAGALVGLQVG